MLLVYVPAVALFTLSVILQLPLAGMFALTNPTMPGVLVSVPAAPVHVDSGAGAVARVRFPGSVWVKLD